MRLNQLIIALLFIFPTSRSYSQDLTVSREMPESGGKIIGFWGSKLISCNTAFGLELKMLDTTDVQPKIKTFKIGPEVEHSKNTAAIAFLVREDFIYEVYYVFTKLVVEANIRNIEGYNVIVKRDLKTMKIVGQKSIDHLATQVKFIKATDEGFYVCFGYSYLYGRGLNYLTTGSYNQISPTLIKGFDYDLESLSSLDLRAYEARIDPYLNELSFDEHSNLFIPIAQRNATDEDDGENKGHVIFLMTNLSGDSISTTLNYKLEEGMNISSVKVWFDERSKKHKGIFIVNGSPEGASDYFANYGYMHLEWNESGKLLSSEFVPFMKEDLLNAELKTSSSEATLDLLKVSKLNLDANVSLFTFLNDGSVLYVANNISTERFREITYSKLIVCISDEGDLKWTRIIPYSSNPIYMNAYFFLQNDELHIYTREFNKNFSTGSYQYEDSRAAANGESVVLTERIMDINTGNVISHKPIIRQPSRKFECYWPVIRIDENGYLIRYRYTKGNKDKWVRIAY